MCADTGAGDVDTDAGMWKTLTCEITFRTKSSSESNFTCLHWMYD